MFFSLKAFKILVFKVYFFMQTSVLKIATESGEANISCDDDEKCVDSVKLLAIDICNFMVL